MAKNKETKTTTKGAKGAGKKTTKPVEPVIYNKENLVDKIVELVVASGGEKSKAEAGRNINEVLDAIASIGAGMNVGDKLQLVGYLTIEKVTRAGREGRNPRTKEVIQIPAKDVLKSKLGAKFQ